MEHDNQYTSMHLNREQTDLWAKWFRVVAGHLEDHSRDTIKKMNVVAETRVMHANYVRDRRKWQCKQSRQQFGN